MIYQGFIITLVGMLSVFVFLMVVILLMNLLQRYAAWWGKKDLSRVAAAIAFAKRNQ